MDFKKIVIAASILLIGPPLIAKEPSYKKVIKHWTRQDQVFVWDNFEARLIWHATYLSDEVRAAQRRKLAELYEWTDAELSDRIHKDAEESAKNDVFVLSIYAGSSAWPEVGKNDADWRLILETDGGKIQESQSLERFPVGQAERVLYPYLDKWSHLYRVAFPKTLQNDGFRLRMTGVPARSELVWKSL